MTPERHAPVMGRIRRIHFVGIGGIGMSSIAEVLLIRGYDVSGSDLKTSDVTARLESLGAEVSEGHSELHVSGADVVVHSSAVDPEQNVETVAARTLGIPIIKRSLMLAELMRMKFGVGIAGSHGKTTTTTMTGLVLDEAGFDPTVVVGGKVAAFGSNARVGEGDVIVVEADEYDRTFLRLTPAVAVVTSVDAEHLDTYGDLEGVKSAFREYLSRVPFFGAAIVNTDDPAVRDVVRDIDRRLVSVGLSAGAGVRAVAVRADGLRTHFSVVHDGQLLGDILLSAPGLHNVRNALAAVAVGLEMDVPFDRIRAGLQRFVGVQRRFEVLAEAADRTVVNDYAHHPTEVAATLQAARSVWPADRIVAVFQPHLYTRTHQLADEFAEALRLADTVVVTDVYAAREEPLPGVTGQTVMDRLTGHPDARYTPSVASLADELSVTTRSGDRIIFMGAGDIWRAAALLADRVSQSDRDRQEADRS